MDANEYFDLLTRRKLPIIIDDEQWRELFVEHGFEVHHFDSGDFLGSQAQPSFAMITRLDYHAKLMARWSESKAVSSHLALAKFDSSPRGIAYTVSQFLSVDFTDTLARRAQYYDSLLSCKDAQAVTSAGVLTCRFRDEIEVANSDVEMEPGWLYSVAEFFESSIINLESDRSSFTLDGDFGFDGLIYLCNNEQLKSGVNTALAALMQLAARGDNAVRFVDSRIERLIVGGQDKTDVIQAMTRGKERGTAPTEFALGCVEFPQTQDWSINSVMNESSNGAHIGVGMGREIPHIDFIAKGAELRFLGPSDS